MCIYINDRQKGSFFSYLYKALFTMFFIQKLSNLLKYSFYNTLNSP